MTDESFPAGRASDMGKDRVSPFISLIVPITSFAPEPFRVISPIYAVVQGEEGDYMATFFDANVGSSGETQLEAIIKLKDMIIICYENLECNDESLGPAMKRQKAVLNEFMKREIRTPESTREED
jgi:hypothetical protein